MPKNPQKLSVFLCHSSGDKPAVRELYQRLLAESWLAAWLDEEKLLPGQDWNLEIQKAVENADAVIICLSSASVSKEGYIQKEMRRALETALEKPEGAIFIIPVRLDDCKPPYSLRAYQYIDFFPATERETTVKRLLASLRMRFETLQGKPAPAQHKTPVTDTPIDPAPKNHGFAAPTGETRRILFLAAEPTNAARLRLGQELREIQEKLQLARLRDQFDLEQRLAVRPVDLSQALLDLQPWMVHFSGHGLSSGELCFETQGGQMFPIKPEALAALFEQFSGQVEGVLLNACYSETQARAISAHIPYVIGMKRELGDEAALAFSVGFYQALGAGRTIEEAYKFGCVQIQLYGIGEHLTPVLMRTDLSRLDNNKNTLWSQLQSLEHNKSKESIKERFSFILDEITMGKKITGRGLSFLDRIKDTPPFLGFHHDRPAISEEYELLITEYFFAQEFVQNNKEFIRVGGLHTSKVGDSWESLAQTTYGNKKYAHNIQAENPNITLLRPGQTIKLPYIDLSGSLGFSSDYIENKFSTAQWDFIEPTFSSLRAQFSLVADEVLQLIQWIYEAAQKTLSNR